MLLKSIDLPETAKRIRYYLSAMLRHHAPRGPYLAARERLFADLARDGLPDGVIDRVNYLNRLAPYSSLAPEVRLDGVDRDRSRYYYDLEETLKYFQVEFGIAYKFGDITEVPPQPTLLKSRPIAGDNSNAVLLNLDRLRHYRLVKDRKPWRAKQPKAVWRGMPHNEQRMELVRRYQKSPLCDIGHVGPTKDGIERKGFLTQREQLNFRYVISVEGNDVATNLKWIMASNSLCLMARPRYETWFMEGNLKDGEHFILLKPDYSDLEERIAELEADPARAEAIVRNANAYVASFSDRPRERLVSLLVAQKYFEATGQLPVSAFTAQFFPEPIASFEKNCYEAAS